MFSEAEEFLHYQEKNRRMSAHTVAAYMNDLKQFCGFLKPLGIENLQACKTSHIRSWMADLLSQGMTPRTIHRKISTLRSIFKYLRKHGMNTDPLARVVMPKMPRQLVKDIPQADLESLFLHFPWHEHAEGERDRLVLLLLYTTGMRLSELTGLRKSDIDIRRNSLTVTGKRNKQRMIPLHPELAEAIEIYTAKQPHPFLIATKNGTRAYPMLIYRIVTKYLQLFSSALKTSPHILRHSFATHMLNNGANLMAIKEILGHTSLSATQVYTKNSFEKLKAIHQLHPRN